MSLRTERVASLIKEEVGTMISRDYREPGLGLITVTEVHVTPDLRIAKIYVSILGNLQVKDAAMQMLEKNKGEIRSLLGSHLRLKFTPALQFYIDETLDRVDKLNELFKQIHKDEKDSGDG